MIRTPGDELRDLLLPLLTQAQVDQLKAQRSVDFCFEREGIGRFRDLGKVRSLLAGRTNVTLAHVADARQISGQAGTK